MINNTYFERLVKSIVSVLGTKDNNVMFIKHYSALLTDKETFEAVIRGFDVRMLYFEFYSSVMQEAYEPVFQWMRQIYEEDYKGRIQLEELLDQCEVYPPLRDVFASIIRDGVASRRDDLIYSEIGHERERMVESIIKFFIYVSKNKNLFFVLINVNQANLATLEIIYRSLKKYECNRIGIMGVFNEAQAITSYTISLFAEIERILDDRNYLFDWDTVDTSNGKLKNKDNSEVPGIFVPKKENVKEYILKINNMYQTFSFEQAAYYLELINQKIERDNIKIDKHDEYKLNALLSIICYLRGDINTSLLIVGNNLHSEGIESLERYWFNYIYVLNQIEQRQLTLAEKGIEACRSIARELDDDLLKFKAEYLHCIAVNYNWSAMFMIDFTKGNTIDEAFVQKLKEHGYNNALAYVYVYLFENDVDFVDDVANGKEKLNYFWKGIEIGNKLKNTTFLLSAYMKNIMLYSARGYHDLANQFYEQRLDIVKQLNDQLMIAHTYNGMGFNNIIAEHYRNADEYFTNSLKIYCALHETEFAAESMYNIATNCFVAGDFEGAYECVTTTLYILEKLDLLTVQMCNASKLYGIAGISCFYKGETYKCMSYLTSMEMIMRHILDNPDADTTLWEEDLCFYHMLEGMLHEDKEPQKALIMFSMASEHLEKVKGNKFIIYAYLVMEQAKTFRLVGDENSAVALLEEAIRYSKDKGYNRRVSELISKLNGMNSFKNKFRFSLDGLTFADIRRFARVGGMEKKLKSRQLDIRLISRWQETLKTLSSNEAKLIKSSMSSIVTTFYLDGGIFIRYEDDRYVNRYCDDRYTYSEEAINRIVAYFSNSPKSFIVNRIERSFREYKSLLDIFGENSIATLVGVVLIDDTKVHSIFLGYVNLHRNFTANNWLMTEDNLTMIRTAFEQVILRCAKINRDKEVKAVNKKLTEMSYTDNLTGLYNRQGFSYKIDCIAKGNTINNNCLLYIDLDDFKYYNDVYGHAIGDKVLVSFAEVLGNNVSYKGYAVRYGGDEFVAVLHKVTKDEVIEIVDKIKYGVENLVTRLLERYYNGEAEIIQNMSIRCSIGASQFEEYSYDGMAKALREADKALYHVKNNLKGQFVFYNSTMEETQNDK